MMRATATEVQNNFGRFLQAVIDGEEVVILRNGHEVARMLSRDSTVSFLTDSLVGVLSTDYDEKSMRSEMISKHAGTY